MFRMVTLVLAWLAWSGHYTYGLHHPLVAVFGAVSCLGVWWLARKLDDSHIYSGETSLGLNVIPYLFWLLLEIVKSSLAVTKIILSRDMPISPRIVKTRASAASGDGRVLYANSITLTPGTITLDMRGDDFYVHAIDAASAEGLQEGEMDRRVASLEKS